MPRRKTCSRLQNPIRCFCREGTVLSRGEYLLATLRRQNQPQTGTGREPGELPCRLRTWRRTNIALALPCHAVSSHANAGPAPEGKLSQFTGLIQTVFDARRSASSLLAEKPGAKRVNQERDEGARKPRSTWRCSNFTLGCCLICQAARAPSRFPFPCH